MTFKAGQSGNPKGRPKGSKDKRTELRELLEPHAPELIQKAVDMALGGDVSALKMCLDRLIPPIKSLEITSEDNTKLTYSEWCRENFGEGLTMKNKVY